MSGDSPFPAMYSGLDDPARWCLPEALAEWAGRRPETTWIVETDGEALSFAQAHTQALQAATFFNSLGISAGDKVGVFMASGCDFVRVWLGLGRRGAASVLLNTELSGDFLKHQLNHAELRWLVVHAALLPWLVALSPHLPHLQHVVVVGDPADPLPSHWTVSTWRAYSDCAPWSGPMPAASDTACIMFTSGTSGPSKGVLMPHAHCVLYGVGAIECLQIEQSDRYYISLPLFHANGLLMQLGATLLAGIPAVVRPKFSASRWLADIQAHRCTLTNLLGATAAFVLAQPAAETDGEHALRAVLSAPNIPVHEDALRKRFKVRDAISGFGMTETNIPIWGRIGHSAPGGAGWVHEDHFEVCIADPVTDMPLAPGGIGEILVRPRIAFGFMAGYLNEPQKTVEAWRNLWFHTGDAGQMREDGLVTFIDRIKDCIRRRGENISPGEVESLVLAIPGISEAVAYAVASDIPGAEDEIMLGVVSDKGQPLPLRRVGELASEQLPRFATPRYIAQFTELPRTATGKVQRAELRKRGVQDALDLAKDQ